MIEDDSHLYSQNLAQQGYNSDQILRTYYGDIERVDNAPIRGITSSYPGTPLRQGSTGPNVVVIQVALNRIAQSYPAIPKIPAADGIFGPRTEASVRTFQEVFGLTPDGVVGPATWYEIVRLYTAVTALSELRSQGQQFYAINWTAPNTLQIGDSGEKVRQLQYMLSVLSKYIPGVPPLTIDGVFGQNTRAAVLAVQRRFNLPETGNVDPETWDELYDQFSGIENTSLRNSALFPSAVTQASNSNVRSVGSFRINNNIPRINYNRTTRMTQFPGRDLSIGAQDPVRQEVVR